MMKEESEEERQPGAHVPLRTRLLQESGAPWMKNAYAEAEDKAKEERSRKRIRGVQLEHPKR